jgi:hypothetical protein
MLERLGWLPPIAMTIVITGCSEETDPAQTAQGAPAVAMPRTEGVVEPARGPDEEVPVATKPDAATATAVENMAEHRDSGIRASNAQSGAAISGISGSASDAATAQDASVDTAQTDMTSRPGRTITLSGVLLQAGLPFTTQRDVKLCVLDHPDNCAQSGPSGIVELQLPANSLTGTILPRGDTYYSSMSPLVTSDLDIAMSGRSPWLNPAAAVAIPLSLFKSLFEQLEVTADPQRGHADFVASALNGGTVSILGTDAGPQWWGNGQTAARFENGPPVGGAQLLGFVNIEPGMVLFRAEKGGRPCKWDPLVWPGEEPGTVRVPIRADTWTRLLEVRCE